MKLIHKKVLAGTLAAGLLIGGGLVLQHNQVFADETSTATPAPKKDTVKDRHHTGIAGQNAKGRGFEGHGFPEGFGLGKGASLDFASILGIEQTVLKEEIKQGKTLVQIAQEKANLTEEALLAKLTEAETKKIDDALSAGKIKQEQADKLKSSLAERLKKIVEMKPSMMASKGAPMFRGGSKPAGIWGNSQEIAAVLGITEEELLTQRKAGKSLAEIAQDKGITEDQLIAKLKDSLTDELKSFVERKGDVHPGKMHQEGPRVKGKPRTDIKPSPTPAQTQ